MNPLWTNSRAARLVAMAVIVLSIPALARADGASSAAVWTAIGPYGGATVRDIAFDPTDSKTLYAASTSGIWKSADAGAHWTDSSAGVKDRYVSSIAVDPNHPSHLWAGADTALYRSSDSGKSWTTVPGQQPIYFYSVTQVVFAPSAPGTLYAAASDGTIKSTDDGAHWTDVDQHQSFSIAVDPTNANTVYVSHVVIVMSPDGKTIVSVTPEVVKSTDGGGHWRKLDGPPGYANLSIDPAHPATLYAANETIAKTTDAGDTWVTLPTPADSSLYATALAPGDPSTVYANGRTGPPDYLPYSARSDDGGEHWTSLGARDPRLAAVVTRVDPHAADVVYEGTWAHGVRKSTDRGVSYSATNEGLGAEPAIAAVFDPNNPKRVLASLDVGGLFRSDDAGTSWTEIGPELALPDTASGIVGLAVDSQSTFYAVRSWGRSGSTTSPVFKSSNLGDTWSPASNGLPTEPTVARALYADPQNPGTVFVALNTFAPGPGTLSHGSLYKTTDGGDTWAAIAPTDAPVAAAAFDASDRTIVISTGETEYTFGSGKDVYVSNDWGTTWDRRKSTAAGIYTLAFGKTSSVIYGASTNLVTNTNDVVRSTDGGLSWTSAAIDSANSPGPANVLAVDPIDPALVYAGTDRGGVWTSADGGKSWSQLDPGIYGVRVQSIVFPPKAPPGDVQSFSFDGRKPASAAVYGGATGAGLIRFFPAPHAEVDPWVHLRHLPGRFRFHWPGVGQMLTCSRGTWSRADAYRITWLRNGKLLQHSANVNYLPKARDRGARIACRVTVVGPGGTSDATSSAVRIGVPKHLVFPRR